MRLVRAGRTAGRRATAVALGLQTGVAMGACTGVPGPPTPDPSARSKTPAVVEPEPTTEVPWDYGDDPRLDGLWEGCAEGDADACGALYAESPVGSPYEAFGATCGGLTTGGGCATEADPLEGDFAEYAQITTWYTAAEADYSGWVHFKAGDANGTTVQEVLGSDLVNLVEEAESMAQTPERVALVDELRSMMLLDGWTELGLAGTEWYEYVYGR